MAVVTYDGKAIIPGPLVSVTKVFQTSEDGAILSALFTIILRGKLVAHKGSPNSTGTFWTSSGYPADETLAENVKLKSILRKQEALRNLFANEGRSLEITPWDGGIPFKCNPRIKNISFTEGDWTQTCDYTIEVEADQTYGTTTEGPSQYLSRQSEDWNVETIDEKLRIYRLTHTVSATGKRFFNSAGTLVQEAWVHAKNWVLTRLGIASFDYYFDNVLDLAGAYQALNHVRGAVQNEKGGTYTVTESWTLDRPQNASSYYATDEYTITTSFDANQRQTIRIDGTITGHERPNIAGAFGDVISTRWQNAFGRWNEVLALLPTRLSTDAYFERPFLVNDPTTRQLGFNKPGGVVTYSYSYVDNYLPAGFYEFNLSVTTNYATPTFATVPVVARTLGPVLQDTGSYTVNTRQISITGKVEAGGVGGYASEPNTDAIVLDNFPGSFVQLFTSQNQINFNRTDGSYSRTVTLTYI